MGDSMDMIADTFVREAERDNLSRCVDFRQESTDDGLTLEGYAAVFNEWVEISDRYGTFKERIAPGAFKRTLGQRMPIIQFDHGMHPLIGSIPLGRFTSIAEDRNGLKVRARLSDNWLVEPVRDAIRDGGITGMSFKFRVVSEEWEKDDDEEYRTITEVELYEAGPVVSPAYESTTVGVRSRQTAIALLDEQVRSEVAHLMTLSTDEVRNLADESPAPEPAPATATPTPTDAPPAEGTQRTPIDPRRVKAKARALLLNPGGS